MSAGQQKIKTKKGYEDKVQKDKKKETKKLFGTGNKEEAQKRWDNLGDVVQDREVWRETGKRKR